MSQPRGASSRRLGAAPPPRPGEVSPGINFSPPSRRCLLPSCLPARLRSLLALSARSASPSPRRQPLAARGRTCGCSARLPGRPQPEAQQAWGARARAGVGGGRPPPRLPHRAHGGRMLSGGRGVRLRYGCRRPLIRRGKLKPRAAVSAEQPGEGRLEGTSGPWGHHVPPQCLRRQGTAAAVCVGTRTQGAGAWQHLREELHPQHGRSCFHGPCPPGAPLRMQLVLEGRSACVGHSPRLLRETSKAGREAAQNAPLSCRAWHTSGLAMMSDSLVQCQP